MAPSKPVAVTPEAPAPAVAGVPDAPAEQKESTVRQRLMGQAMIVLREAHRTEFDQIASEMFTKEGLSYSRRQSPAEKAEAKIRALAAEAGISVSFGSDEADAEADAEA